MPDTMELTGHVRALHSLSKHAIELLALEDEDTVLDRTAAAVVNLLAVDHCGIVLVEPGQDFGVVRSEFPAHGSRGARLAITNNPLWDALFRQPDQPLVLNDVLNDARVEPSTRQALSGLGVFSMAIIPIVVQDIVVGGVGLDMYSPGRLITPDMLEIGLILTSQLNSTLQKLRLVADLNANARQLSQQVKRLEALNQFAAIIAETRDEQAMLDGTLRLLPELLEIDHCGLVLLDPSELTGTVVSEYPSTGSVGRQVPVTGYQLFEQVVKTHRQPAVINDVATDPRLESDYRDVLLSVGIRGLAILPLVVRNRVIGSLGLDLFTTSRTFAPETVDLARTVAGQLAGALQNLRLYTETRRQADQLSRLTVFSQLVQASLSPDDILRALLEETSQVMACDQAEVLLYDLARQELRRAATLSGGNTVLTVQTGDRVPLEGAVARVWETWKPLLVTDAGEDGPYRSQMVAPILSRGRILGLAGVYASRTYAYGASDMDYFSQMINQLAVALENSDAYQQSQRVARNEALINAISQQLQRQMDIQSMLKVTASELGKTLGARRARVRLGVSGQDDGSSERSTD